MCAAPPEWEEAHLEVKTCRRDLLAGSLRFSYTAHSGIGLVRPQRGESLQDVVPVRRADTD
jgi:hypothetical protein